MINYVAFLRGINVGGKKLIKMEELRGAFESLRFQNVRTFIASGNVLFENDEADRVALAKKIEKKLLKQFGHEISIVLQTIPELESILKVSPFKKIKPNPDLMMSVVFFTLDPKRKGKLPLVSDTEHLEVLAIKHRAAFILSHRKKNGSFSFPNNFFEKEFGVTATTRTVNTVQRITALAKAKL